jgi:hypothetical protein
MSDESKQFTTQGVMKMKSRQHVMPPTSRHLSIVRSDCEGDETTIEETGWDIKFIGKTDGATCPACGHVGPVVSGLHLCSAMGDIVQPLCADCEGKNPEEIVASLRAARRWYADCPPTRRGLTLLQAISDYPDAVWQSGPGLIWHTSMLTTPEANEADLELDQPVVWYQGDLYACVPGSAAQSEPLLRMLRMRRDLTLCDLLEQTKVSRWIDMAGTVWHPTELLDRQELWQLGAPARVYVVEPGTGTDSDYIVVATWPDRLPLFAVLLDEDESADGLRLALPRESVTTELFIAIADPEYGLPACYNVKMPHEALATLKMLRRHLDQSRGVGRRRPGPREHPAWPVARTNLA